jgi:HAL2 family 3'(2'),5'-bisphosphate nucleotidase
LDPIDGTKGFIRGEHFCVALGMALEGKPVLGVLACPNVPSSTSRSNGASLGDGCVFFALKGQGAFMLPLEANGSSLAEEITHAVPIRVSPATAGEEARFFESVETAHSSHSVGAEAARALGVLTPPVQMDSQCKYGLLARGEGEVMLRLPRLGYIENIWDHAPAYVVITEAGGRVTDTEGKELDFAEGCRSGTGKMGREVTGIVTTNGRLHDLVVESLRSFWPPRGG